MRVIYKKTGERGTIPDNQFDPNLFDPEVKKKEDGLFTKIAKFFAPIATNVGQQAVDIGGAFTDVASYKLASDPNEKLKQAKEYTERVNRIKENQKFFGFDADKKDNQFDPIKYAGGVTKGALEAGSYMIPMGKGATLTSKAIIPGAVSGGMSAASKEGASIESVGKGVVGGGATAGVLGKIGSKMPFKNADKVAEKEIMNLGKSVKSGAKMMSEEDALFNTLTERMGIHGKNAEEFLRNGEKAYNRLYKEVGDAIKSDKKMKSFKKIEYEIRNYLEKESDNFVPNDPFHNAVLNKKLVQLDKMKDASGKLSKEAIFTFKNKLASELKNTWSRIRNPNGTPPTPKEEVLLDLWKKMDDYISSDPIVKEKLGQMGAWDQASEGLKKSKDRLIEGKLFNIPLTGNLNKTTQNVKSGFAKLVSGVSSIPESINNYKGGLGTKAIINAENSFGAPESEQDKQSSEDRLRNYMFPNGGDQQNQEQFTSITGDDGNQYKQSSDGSIYTLDDQWMFDEASSDWIPNPNTFGSQDTNGETNTNAPATLEQYNQALSMLAQQGTVNSSRQYDLLAKEREYYYPEKKEVKLTESQQAQKSVGELTGLALNDLNSKDIKIGKFGEQATIEGLKSKFSAGDPDTVAFNIRLSAIKAAIAKIRAGTSFTPNEEALLNEYTPGVGDSKQRIIEKLIQLNDFYGKKQFTQAADSDILSEFMFNNRQ